MHLRRPEIFAVHRAAGERIVPFGSHRVVVRGTWSGTDNYKNRVYGQTSSILKRVSDREKEVEKVHKTNPRFS